LSLGKFQTHDFLDLEGDVEKLIEKTEVEGDQQAATKETGLSFAFAKVWAAHKDAMEEIQEDVPDIEQGDSWLQALERIAAVKDAKKVAEVTGRGVRRKAAAIFPQVNRMTPALMYKPHGVCSKNLTTLRVSRIRPTRARKRRIVDRQNPMLPAIQTIIRARLHK